MEETIPRERERARERERCNAPEMKGGHEGMVERAKAIARRRGH